MVLEFKIAVTIGKKVTVISRRPRSLSAGLVWVSVRAVVMIQVYLGWDNSPNHLLFVYFSVVHVSNIF